uniref:7TM_GPCR_Srx domain-containing protein n=1 Tax=Steinernema glaseri TaxID=37863 RepID=A0A1I7YJA8_9BILA
MDTIIKIMIIRKNRNGCIMKQCVNKSEISLCVSRQLGQVVLNPEKDQYWRRIADMNIISFCLIVFCIAGSVDAFFLNNMLAFKGRNGNSESVPSRRSEKLASSGRAMWPENRPYLGYKQRWNLKLLMQ